MLDVLVEDVLARRARAASGRTACRGSRTNAMKNSPASRWPDPVGAVGEVVAAAQDPDAVEVGLVGQSDVRLDGDRRLAVGALLREVRLVELLLLAQRSAGRLVATDDRLLVLEIGPVPDLDVHADATGDQVGPPGHPGGRPGDVGRGHPDVARSTAVVSSALTLAVPSLNPNRFRGVAWLVLVDEVRPNPSWDQRTETMPKPSRMRLRTAWTATCGSFGAGLDADVAAGPGGVEVVAAERRQLLQRRRAPVGQPEPAVEQGRPEPDGQRSVPEAGSP